MSSNLHPPSPHIDSTARPPTPWVQTNPMDDDIQAQAQSTPFASPLVGGGFRPLSPSGSPPPPLSPPPTFDEDDAISTRPSRPPLVPLDTLELGRREERRSNRASHGAGPDDDSGVFVDEITLSGSVTGEGEEWRSTMAESAILISPERASDYAKMSMSSATPPPSDASLNTYLSRFVHLVKKVQKMTWFNDDRVTDDYYPGKGPGVKGRKGKGKGRDLNDLYDRRRMHVIAVSWKSRRYIEWRQSHYGHVAASSVPSEEDFDESYGGSESLGPESVTGIIEPFPFTTSNEMNRSAHV